MVLIFRTGYFKQDISNRIFQTGHGFRVVYAYFPEIEVVHTFVLLCMVTVTGMFVDEVIERYKVFRDSYILAMKCAVLLSVLLWLGDVLCEDEAKYNPHVVLCNVSNVEFNVQVLWPEVDLFWTTTMTSLSFGSGCIVGPLEQDVMFHFEEDLTVMEHSGSADLLPLQNDFHAVTACVNHLWFPTGTLYFAVGDHEGDSWCEIYTCMLSGVCLRKSSYDELWQNTTYISVAESDGLVAFLEFRTTILARKAWCGQKGQFGKARGYHKRGIDNMSNNTFVHNGGGYDCEVFVFTQLFAAGIEHQPGPAGGCFLDTGETCVPVSSPDDGSTCTLFTSETPQRKRSRSPEGVAVQQEVSICLYIYFCSLHASHVRFMMCF